MLNPNSSLPTAEIKDNRCINNLVAQAVRDCKNLDVKCELL